MGSVEELEASGDPHGISPGSRVRLLRLAVSCPRCGSRPALRVTERAARAFEHHPPAERLGTFQCQRRQCGNIYDLTAAAYHNAS